MLRRILNPNLGLAKNSTFGVGVACHGACNRIFRIKYIKYILCKNQALKNIEIMNLEL